MTSERRSLTLTPEQWRRLDELAADTDSTATAGPTYGEPTWRAFIRRIADEELEVVMATQYQYWQHKRSGETFAVMIEQGVPTGINGPLHWREVEENSPEDYNYDYPFLDDPTDYKLAYKPA